jgi:uncharacterized protein (TIGR02679 family)
MCVDGMPAAAQRTLLAQLRQAGARLRYHGDFDWPGITIARGLYGREGAEPWRMGTADYLDAPEGPPLEGNVVDTHWDDALAPAMVCRGRAVHEEAVLSDLLEDLTTGKSASER